MDVHTHQVVDVPELLLQRGPHARRAVGPDAAGRGQQPADFALSSSTQIAPNYWINPRNSVDYPVAVQTPQYRVDSTSELAAHSHLTRPAGRRRSC